MIFSSSIFLFVFLPLVLAVYYNPFIKSRWFKNLILLGASLGFYAWGEPLFVLVMLASIIFNYGFGLLLKKYQSFMLLMLNILGNIGILFVFKYLSFTIINLNSLLKLDLFDPKLVLPIGISFFTFQAMSYVIDVYKGKVEPQRNILNLGLYISFFPQLIAGPIVRYVDIASEIMHREFNSTDFNNGVQIFIFGLAKKVLLANTFATLADLSFDSNLGMLSMFGAWLGAIAYTLQIYFDFGGYSDMAIGLGQMFGFHFLKNFNYPYMATSITDFWRRWHISLSSWFRDYVYIPLGGNRVKLPRWIFNISVVWLLTGLWHGANWTFIAWGLFYLIWLLFEKLGPFKQHKYWWKHLYTLLIVIVGWVLFRSPSIGSAVDYLKCMLGANGLIDNISLLYLENFGVYLVVGIIACINLQPLVMRYYQKLDAKVRDTLYIGFMFGLFMITITFVVKGTYNPFIYFNF